MKNVFGVHIWQGFRGQSETFLALSSRKLNLSHLTQLNLINFCILLFFWKIFVSYTILHFFAILLYFIFLAVIIGYSVDKVYGELLQMEVIESQVSDFCFETLLIVSSSWVYYTINLMAFCIVKILISFL